MTEAGQRLTNLYLASAVIGVLAVITRFALPLTSSFAVVLGYIFDILIGVVVVLIAIRAKKTMDRAPMRASLAGVIYSLISGIANLLFPPSAAALRKAMLQQSSNLTQSQMNAAINLTRSLGVRLGELIVALLFGWLLTLFVGWIATLFVQGGDRQAV
ncbi:MAG: hypothetical protein M0Z66_08365 [Thermaerobacter sp.]|nr:hypothetical protein [Thermaerobacter sp.]